MALGKFKLALRDFEAVKKAKPRDPDALVSIYSIVYMKYSLYNNRLNTMNVPR